VQVVISKAALDHFRSKARNSSKEIMAYMVGELSDGVVTVHRLAYPKRYAHQTNTAVSWRMDEYRNLRRLVQENSQALVGFLHSHPDDWDCVMSPADYAVCLSEGSIVCGIVSVYGRASRVRFWAMNSPLPCVITHK
jgi:proteasome lid subunit RPN8/RPN11